MRAPQYFALALLCVSMTVGQAVAQEHADPLARIAPAEQPAADSAILTTHDSPSTAAPAGLPWKQADPAAAATEPAPLQYPTPPLTPPAAAYQPKVPFGRAEYSTKPVPSGPRSVTAVPVVGVDAVETSEPAPPTPTDPEADPAQENPEEPTELTSPIFVEESLPVASRSTVLRALNKVTAQSELLRLKPNGVARFGQIEVTAVTCQTSAPNSQTDHAALLDIVELASAGQPAKSLFRGWMYASSPSIAALEHPVYDITMVLCDIMPSGTKEEPKEAKKTEAKPKN